MDDYYPFGLEISGRVNSPQNKYLYNKNELQDGLAQYDYGARFYDPLTGRWTSTDPLAEAAFALTPLRYAFNNPIRIIDKNGLYEEDGRYWIVYLLATQLGLRNAGQLADAAEWPDDMLTYLVPGLQQKYHALTGGNGDYVSRPEKS